MSKLTQDQAQQYRKIANQAHYAAQYIAQCHGDPRYLETIRKFYVSTETGEQPLVTDIHETIVYKTDPLAVQTLAYCADQYEQNSSLINAYFRAVGK